MLFLAAAPGAAQPPPPAAQSPVKSVVRTDPRSGRLVRSVVAPRTPRSAKPSLRLNELIDQTAARHEVDPLLVRSVVAVESNFNPYAVSPKGAQGLMQLIPATARRFGVTNPFDPASNLEAGVRYLKYLKDLFQDERLALAAYNAGEGAVQRHNGIPPYAETRDYVEKVRRLYGASRQAAPAPSAAPQAPAEPESPVLRGLETVTGPDGRVWLRTRP
jgi:soluble lytic murein transglycosylase-like protein